MIELMEQLKHYVEGMAANVLLNIGKPRGKMRGYKVIFKSVVNVNKKILNRALKSIESHASRAAGGTGRTLLVVLNKLGIMTNQMSIDDITTKAKQSKPGKYHVVIVLSAKAENKQALVKIVESAENKIKGIPSFVISNLLGIPNNSAEIEEYTIKVE